MPADDFYITSDLLARTTYTLEHLVNFKGDEPVYLDGRFCGKTVKDVIHFDANNELILDEPTSTILAYVAERLDDHHDSIYFNRLGGPIHQKQINIKKVKETLDEAYSDYNDYGICFAFKVTDAADIASMTDAFAFEQGASEA